MGIPYVYLSISLFGQYGAFNNLHDKKDGRELSASLQIAAIDEAFECFQQWRNHFGKGGIEKPQILQAVKDFIDHFGDAHFSYTDE